MWVCHMHLACLVRSSQLPRPPDCWLLAGPWPQLGLKDSMGSPQLLPQLKPTSCFSSLTLQPDSSETVCQEGVGPGSHMAAKGAGECNPEVGWGWGSSMGWPLSNRKWEGKFLLSLSLAGARVCLLWSGSSVVIQHLALLPINFRLHSSVSSLLVHGGTTSKLKHQQLIPCRRLFPSELRQPDSRICPILLSRHWTRR